MILSQHVDTQCHSHFISVENKTCLSFPFRDKHLTVDFQKNSFRMYLMYYMSEEGNRVYTLAKTDPAGNPTFSAHPARWSKRHRVT